MIALVSVIITFLYIFGAAKLDGKKKPEKDAKIPIQAKLTEQPVRTEAHSAAL